MIEPKVPTKKALALRKEDALGLFPACLFPWLCSLSAPRSFSLGPLDKNLALGLMFVALGTVFTAYEGTSALSSLYEAYGATDLAYAAESWVGSVPQLVPGHLLVAVVLVALALARVGVCLRKRNGKPYGGSRYGEEASR